MPVQSAQLRLDGHLSALRGSSASCRFLYLWQPWSLLEFTEKSVQVLSSARSAFLPSFSFLT